MSIAFDRSKKTFLGFLQARGKSLNTIKNYACDLDSLGSFCKKYQIDFQKLGLNELEAYHQNLKEQGLRPNSRRRKLVTAKTFLRYLSGRMEVSIVGAEKLIPPEKVEKPPKVVSHLQIQEILDTQPEHDIGCRNRALIRVLLETGMLVTEALNLRAQDCVWLESGALLHILGKRARSVPVGSQTALALKELHQRLNGAPYFFYGYTRSGPNPEKLTPRGVEVLFKAWAKTFGIDHLHPRTLRHVYILDRLREGKSENDIMQSLGLKTAYIFKVYRELVSEKPLVLDQQERA